MPYIVCVVFVAWFVTTSAACTVEREAPNLVGQDIRVTVIHTADIHSRLFPYRYVPNSPEQGNGLIPGNGPFGGIARIGAIVKRERAKAARSIWLDSGDCFQGAPIFNVYKGEVEMRALSLLGVDAAVIGNHEFDLGANNLYEQYVTWAHYPMLAANYYFEDPREPGKPKLAEVIQPFQLFDLDGVKVAVIGMANISTITSLEEGGNALGVRPLDDNETVAKYVRLLRPVSDVVVLLSHLGLDEDEGLAPTQVRDTNTTLPLEGVDLILGGHLHIVLDPPKIAFTDRYGHNTILTHSGAFAKFVGRLDLVVRVGADNADPQKRSAVSAFKYEIIPVDCAAATKGGPCTTPSDPQTTALLQPYDFELHQLLNLDGVFAYVVPAGKIQRNDASGGDSQLGNLVARSMQLRPGVNADFAMTNSLGIRADFEQGPLTLEDMYNVFPFENTIVLMYLSGNEIQETLDFVARKSSDRGCKTQVQVSGLWFTLVCGQNAHAEEIYIGEKCRRDDGTIDASRCQKVIPVGLYRVAVNDYIAAGGSGFTVLKRNTSKLDTKISLRDGLRDYIRGLPACTPDQIDETDPAHTVVRNYGVVTCLDSALEQHEGRILTRFE
ncbi:MAG TPA: bifunctional UDP-sugar hydrolase/5'-nucleotidase [Haliangiales bacterium]|nr:bifunctional UDP-sugar hydrolase/5'-nucleotidase [Haliangiales bacterium]